MTDFYDQLVASDLSEKEIERARREAHSSGAAIAFSVCDMRQAHAHHGTGFDVVISLRPDFLLH